MVTLVKVPINALCLTPNPSADYMGYLNSLSGKTYRFASCFLTHDWISGGLTCQTFAGNKYCFQCNNLLHRKEKKMFTLMRFSLNRLTP